MNRYTKAGTDIEEVKRLNSHSGYTYNEAKKLLQEQYERQQKKNGPNP